MTANIHPETGIAYGTIYGNAVMELVDEIMTQGEDLSWKAWKEGMAATLKSKYADLDAESSEDEIRQAILSAIKNETNAGDESAAKYADGSDVIPAFVDGLRDDEEPDFPELVDWLLDAGLNDRLEFDEPDYDYEQDTAHGKVKYHLGWLGGAILIWVIESPWVIGCRECSPCVPNAGNLEQPGDEHANCLAYSLPPDELPEGYEGQPHLFDPSK